MFLTGSRRTFYHVKNNLTNFHPLPLSFSSGEHCEDCPGSWSEQSNCAHYRQQPSRPIRCPINNQSNRSNIRWQPIHTSYNVNSWCNWWYLILQFDWLSNMLMFPNNKEWINTKSCYLDYKVTLQIMLFFKKKTVA